MKTTLADNRELVVSVLTTMVITATLIYFLGVWGMLIGWMLAVPIGFICAKARLIRKLREERHEEPL